MHFYAKLILLQIKFLGSLRRSNSIFTQRGLRKRSVVLWLWQEFRWNRWLRTWAQSMDWMHMTSHGAKRRRTSDNEPSQNKNKCIDLILSQPHDPQMLFFSSAAFTTRDPGSRSEHMEIKCTYCYMGDYCTVSAIIYMQKWKVIWMRNEIMHYWDQCIILLITVVSCTHSI